MGDEKARDSLSLIIHPGGQSIKIGIDLSLDKSIKIGKSDLIDIYCIDQSVEIDDTLVTFIDLYRKIHLFFCSSKDENCFHSNSCQLSCN